MTDAELCKALTGRLQSAIYRNGWSGYQDDYNTGPVAIHRDGENDANSYMVLFKVGTGNYAVDVCIWASDLHLHVFANGACLLHKAVGELLAYEIELWNAVRGVRSGGAMPDAARARENLVAVLGGGAT